MSLRAIEVPAPLREDIKVRKFVRHGEVEYILKEPDSGSYYKFDEPQYLMLTLFDGQHDLDQLLLKFDEVSDEYAYDMESLHELVGDARDCKLLEPSKAEQNIALLERLKEERRGRRMQLKGSLLHMRFSVWDPDKFFNRVIDSLRWVWHPAFVYGSLALIMFAVLVVVANGDRFAAELTDLGQRIQQTPSLAVIIWFIALGAIALHECAHGLTCKHFGGEVNEIGFLFLAFQPCMYCNVNDAWLFENTRHKIFVAAAGVWAEFVLSALMVFVWLVVEQGSVIGFVAFVLILVSTASSLLMNMNPLMKFDGYYILSDVLKMPNLRENAISWFSWNLKRHLLRLPVEQPLYPSKRERRFYFYYGMAIVLYLTIMLSGIAGLLYGVLAPLIGTVGIILYIWLVAKLAIKILGSWPATIKELIMKICWSSKIRRVFTGVGMVAAVLALIFLHSPVTIISTGTVEADLHVVHAPESGFVEQVGYREDRSLADGKPLFSLYSPNLELEDSQLEAQDRGLQLDRQTAQSVKDPAMLRRTSISGKSLSKRKEFLRQRIDHLVINAPEGEWRVDGPPPITLQGRYFNQGSPVLTLISAHERTMTVVLEQSDLNFVSEGAETLIQLTGNSDQLLQGKVERIAPVAKRDGPDRLFQLRINLNTQGQEVPLGISGKVKIYGSDRPLWEHVLRPIRKTLRADIWL